MLRENLPIDQILWQASVILVCLILLFGLILLSFFFQSGWRTLWKKYSVAEFDLQKAWDFESATFNSPFGGYWFGGRFNRSLRFGYSQDGVFVGAIFPFSVVLRPFVIPWNEVILTIIDGYAIASTEVPFVSISISKQVYDGIIGSNRIEHLDGLGELNLVG